MSMHVNLTPALEEYVRERVRQGLYGTASEVIREALRLLAARDREAEARLAALGTASPPGPGRGSSPPGEALDLVATGLDLMEQNLRRDHPDATEEEVDRLALEWMSGTAWSQETPGYLVRSPGRLARLLRDED